MKKNLLLFLLLASGFAYGQITLQHSDYQNAFSQGSVYLTYSTEIGGPDIEVYVGQPSSTAQTWDLTAIPMEYMGISNSIEPSTAPFINDFPASNIVLYEKLWLGENDTIYSWNYKNLSSDELRLLGESDEFSIFMTYDPPAVQAKLPMTLGTTWMREKDSTEVMPGLYTISETEVTIDAFGTLKLTSGQFPCLRMRQDSRTISVYPGGSDTLKTRSYNLYTQQMIEVHLGTIQEDQFNQQTIWVSGVKVSGKQGSLGIPTIDPSRSNALLYTIYPNPVTDKAEILYNLPHNAEVNILITDLTGREIGKVLNENQTAGNHSASFNASTLPSGVYMIRLESNGTNVTQKIVVYR